ncbi:hypothetical protein OPQ81_006752 [Rhizoctonia solani]|nr:hypothetical protein OPQ81_006752 [Rhizoctonia solani]
MQSQRTGSVSSAKRVELVSSIGQVIVESNVGHYDFPDIDITVDAQGFRIDYIYLLNTLVNISVHCASST